MKPFILILAVLATGCSTMDKIVCTGTGTCLAKGEFTNTAARSVPTGGEQIHLPTGSFLIVRSQSTGAVMSVIQTATSK